MPRRPRKSAPLKLTAVRGIVSLILVLLAGSYSTAFAQVPRVTPVVHEVYPHDPQAFTQGLLFWQGRLFESTGQRGQSTLRRVELSTGAVERQVNLDPSEFGEGLARVEDKLVQLTWTAGKAHIYALDSFAQLGTHEYSGQGWGLCFDGRRLIMSDGSSSLFFRDPQTFDVLDSIRVLSAGRAVNRLNELECVDGFVYANVWQTDEIVKIDAASGQVVVTIEAGGLLTPAEARRADVLNGIAHVPATGRFYITGKLWPKLFEVTFPAAASPDDRATGPAEQTDAAPEATSVPGAQTVHTGGASGRESTHAPTAPRVLSNCHCATAGWASRGLSGAWVGFGVLWWLRRWARERIHNRVR